MSFEKETREVTSVVSFLLDGGDKNSSKKVHLGMHLLLQLLKSFIFNFGQRKSQFQSPLHCCKVKIKSEVNDRICWFSKVRMFSQLKLLRLFLKFSRTFHRKSAFIFLDLRCVQTYPISLEQLFFFGNESIIGFFQCLFAISVLLFQISKWYNFVQLSGQSQKRASDNEDLDLIPSMTSLLTYFAFFSESCASEKIYI